MRRRLLFLLATLVAACCVVLLTLPFWMGAVVGWTAKSRGVSFRSYERIGYSRFAFHDVEVRRAGLRVTASRIEADTPLLWAWHHWRTQPNKILADKWLVEVGPRTPSPGPPRESGWVPLRAKLQQISAQLERWLPSADAGPGLVRWPGGELALAGAGWHARQLTVKELAFRAVKVDGTARFDQTGDRIAVAVRSVTEPASATLESRGPAVAGEVVWFDQHAPISATFAPTGWLPREASILADDWHVPGARVKLGAAYGEIRGRAKIDWAEGKFVTDIQARGEPVAGKNAPPLTVDVRGHGTPQEFTVEALHAALPGVDAQLNESVTIERSGKIRSGTAAQFALKVDLAKQPWFAAKGSAEGEARLVSDIGASSIVEFRMRASDISARDVDLSRVEAQGRFQWPRVEIASATIAAGEGEQLQLRGGWDIRARSALDVVLSGRIRRQSLARFLPAQPEFDVITIEASAEGPLATLQHRGQARVDEVKVKGMNPFGLALEWRGQGPAAETFTATLAAKATRLRVAGSADREAVRLQELALLREDAPLLRLTGPTAIRWKPKLQLEPIHLAGEEASLNGSIAWGETGRVEAAGRNIPSAWLADLVDLKGPAWKIDLLAFTGTWDRAPMQYALTLGATVDLGEQRSAAVMISTRGNKDGLQIEALRATEGEATVLNAIGHLPVTLQPAGRPLLRIDEAGALALDAAAAPHSAFWPKLAALTGVELKEPNAELHLKGTWQRPKGSVELHAERVAFDSKRVKREIPTVEALDVQLTADRGGVTLRTFSVKVEGQLVRASGRLPVADGAWSDLYKQPGSLLEKDAQLHLEIPEAEISVFTRFLPPVLAPQGRIVLDVNYERGGLTGFARLRDAASRPLGPLGILQEINAEVGLEGRTATLRSVSAKSGGQPVSLTGVVELPAGGAPRYDLALRGENLPFVRQTGLLLRGDLDLKLQTPKEGAPRITGTVRLRDSLFLQDVRAFLPRGGGGGGAARRPPYFSVETPPLNTWVLAIEVTGEEFMRLRTPVFNGVASAHFRLGGTLGEPRALGEVTIDEGSVRMPFASFAVKQGSVRLTEANPHEPEIYLRGTSRRYGYDLTLEIEGAASTPNVEFSSSPALESEQVLLMVMTGSPPSTELTNTATKRVAQIGVFLGQSLIGSLGGDSANAERLTIATGKERVSRQGRETYEIEYKLSDRWTATGEYNQYDEYNAGLKWRVLPRPKAGEPAEAKAHEPK